MKVELPGGHWAELRELDEITAGHRKRMWKAWDAAWEDPEGGTATRQLAAVDEVICMMVSSWDLELPLPETNPAVLDDLPITTYNALAKAVDPYADKLRIRFDVDPDPESPTSPSRTTEPS